MKFLQVHCETRSTMVFINTEKIVMISQATAVEEGEVYSLIEVEGLNDGKGAVKVRMPADSLTRMINGEDKTRIGFRTS
jgi:hypothetical protein